MWGLDHKEGWASKNGCFPTVVLEKTLESPVDYKEIKPVNPKGNQPWIFTGGTDAEAEASILWLPDAKSWLLGKDQVGEGDDIEWDGWTASPIQWTWVWANSGRWWRTGKPGMLQSMGVAKSWTRLSKWTRYLKNVCTYLISFTFFLKEQVYAVVPFWKESHESTDVGDFWEWGLQTEEEREIDILFWIFYHIACISLTNNLFKICYRILPKKM